MKINVTVCRWRSLPPATADGNFTGVLVHRVGCQFTDGSPGRNSDAGSHCEVFQHAVVENIAEVSVGDLLTVLAQYAGRELIAEQTEVAGREIKQRADAR